MSAPTSRHREAEQFAHDLVEILGFLGTLAMIAILAVLMLGQHEEQPPTRPPSSRTITIDGTPYECRPAPPAAPVEGP